MAGCEVERELVDRTASGSRIDGRQDAAHIQRGGAGN